MAKGIAEDESTLPSVTPTSPRLRGSVVEVRPLTRIAVTTLPLVLGAWGAPLVADRLGVLAGAWAAEAAAAIDGARPLAPPAVLGDEAGVVELESADLPAAPTPAMPAGPRAPRSIAHGHGIRVRAATVLRLANAGVRPSATLVPASGARPAGLALAGVSGLGVGVRDGDVLTDVSGAPASSVIAVVNAVVAARSAHAPAVGGHFWREGAPWQLVVEMPYVE
jgi:hypothetical protein